MSFLVRVGPAGAVAVLWAAVAQALPVQIAVEKMPALFGHLPENVVVYGPESGRGEVAAVTSQVDSRSPSGNLVFTGQSHPEDDAKTLVRTGGILPPAAQRAFPLEPQDLVTVDESSFAECDTACESRVKKLADRDCGMSTRAYRANMADGKSVYVIACGNGRAINQAWKKNSVPAVRLDLARRRLWSDTLEYVYDKDNHMLLDRFGLRTKSSAQDHEALLVGSEIHLYGKPNYFFPMHFTSDDIASSLGAYLQKPLGTSGRLSFFLDVLFFKVKLDLTSTVTLFRDAVHVPVVMTLPISGTSLREGSGMFYGFRAASPALLAAVQTSMPRLGSSRAPPRKGAPSSFFLAHKGSCVAVSIDEPPEFDTLGFHPQMAYPGDLASIEFPKVAADFGVFYDITKLRKGRYRFDVWFRVGQGDAACAKLKGATSRDFAVSVFPLSSG